MAKLGFDARERQADLIQRFCFAAASGVEEVYLARCGPSRRYPESCIENVPIWRRTIAAVDDEWLPGVFDVTGAELKKKK